MKFKSNSKYGEPVESGTIYSGEIGKLRIIVHRIIHCKGWYLSCADLRISQIQLKSDTIMGAIKESKEVLKNIVDELSKDVKEFCESDVELLR